MSKPRKKKATSGVVEANLIPILSCMFLLIPALLLAMEVARFSSVTVHPPKFTHTTTDAASLPKDPLHVRVMIRADGFEAKVRRTDAPGPDVEVIPLTGSDLDFAGLSAFAATIKRQFPDHAQVEVTAEADVPLEKVVATLDALRGPTCSLVDAHADQTVPDDCFLWQAVISS
jgi:biopolymer transport protein ExbD